MAQDEYNKVELPASPNCTINVSLRELDAKGESAEKVMKGYLQELGYE